MKRKTYKVTVKRVDTEQGVFQSEKPYILHSIHGAAGVTRVANGKFVKPDYYVGDRLDHQVLKELIDNPENDVTVTL